MGPSGGSRSCHAVDSHESRRRQGQSRETWISFSRNIGATRDGNMVRYDDFRSGIRYEYDLPQKKLYRLSVTDGAAEEIESLEGLFQAIFRGDAIREGDLFPASHRQAAAADGDRTRPAMDPVRIGVGERQGGSPKPPMRFHTVSMVIRVDPEKMLPDSMTVTAREGREVQMTFDYPAEGPADIYALGVPRDAPVEDRMPPPDLNRILKIVRQNRHDFDDYLAVAGGNYRTSLASCT